MVVRLSHQRAHRNIPTGIRAKKSDFLENGGLYRNNSETNAELLEILQTYNQRFREIPERTVSTASVQQLKSMLPNSEARPEVFFSLIMLTSANM